MTVEGNKQFNKCYNNLDLQPCWLFVVSFLAFSPANILVLSTATRISCPAQLGKSNILDTAKNSAGSTNINSRYFKFGTKETTYIYTYPIHLGEDN